MSWAPVYWWTDEKRAHRAREGGEWAEDIARDAGEHEPQPRFCLYPDPDTCPECGERIEDDPDPYRDPDDQTCWCCESEMQP